MVTIASNISSLNAQRKLAETTGKLSSIFERLSSGQRINRAIDDSAGLAVASGLDLDRLIFSRGVRNLNDGLSALSIAESAIDSLGQIVTRLQEIAEQAANGVYSTTQRASLNAEAQSLSEEYFRISKNTEFNGRNLLDGTLGELRLQCGYEANGSIAAGLGGAMGTGSFESPGSFAVGDAPNCVKLADLNGDGSLDAITADITSNTVSVLLGQGDGGFEVADSYSTGTSPASVVLGDLNGDGILDMATANSGDINTTVLLGRGDGTFDDGGSYSTGLFPSSAALGDLNGDGNLDLLVTNAWDDNVNVLLGNGDGSFNDRSSFSIGLANCKATSLGDLNGDGILDLAVADYMAMKFGVFMGNGDGTFKSGTTYATGLGPISLALGDLNGDEILDAVTVGNWDSIANVFIGKGDGTFSETSFLTGTVGMASPDGVALGDIDGDGVLDLAFINVMGNDLVIFAGNGDGTFAVGTSYSTGANPISVAFGDLDKDGVLDIVTADKNADQISTFLAQTKDGVSPLLSFDLSTAAGARQALPVFQQKASQLAVQLGQIGAFQSRLGSAIAVAATAAENFAAAAGRITDLDIAEETANLVRHQILQQSGVAVLAQANQQTTTVLALLQDI